MKYKNLLVFKPVDDIDTFDRDVQINLDLWTATVGANGRYPDGTMGAMARLPRALQAGSWYYYLIEAGQIEHVYGLEYFDHYIELPITWLDEVYSTKEVTDEEGNTTTVNILNKEVYRAKHTNTSETHILVRISDDNFKKLYTLINFVEMTVYGALIAYPINVVCNDKYDELIMEGGRYYISPIEEGII